jgi:hypothetical protein
VGSGRDKRKKAKGGKTPGAGADKTVRKTEANDEKATRRLERKAKVRTLLWKARQGRGGKRGASSGNQALAGAPCPLPAWPPRRSARARAAALGCSPALCPTAQRPPPPHTHPPVLLLGWVQGGEDDIDALLAGFALEDKARRSVTVEEGCAPPTPRVYSSFVPIPSQARRPPAAAPMLLPLPRCTSCLLLLPFFHCRHLIPLPPLASAPRHLICHLL